MGKTFLATRLERPPDLGGCFEFRSVAYYMDCKAGCIGNPRPTGELRFTTQTLTRGRADFEAFVCPTQGLRLIADGAEDRLSLFDQDTEKRQNVSMGSLPGESSKPARDEAVQPVVLTSCGGHWPAPVRFQGECGESAE